MPQLTIIDWFGLITGISGILAFVSAVLDFPNGRRQLFLGVGAGFLIIAGATQVFPFTNSHQIVTALIFTTSLSVLSIMAGIWIGKRQIMSKSIIAPEDVVSVHSQRLNASLWLQAQLSDVKPPITVDAFGVKLDALYRIVKGTGPNTQLPSGKKCSLRVLILGRGTIGMETRRVIELHDKVEKDVEVYNEAWLQVAHSFSDKIGSEHVLEVRCFTFTPSFYMLRVNDRMFIGTYLAETGYDNLTLELRQKNGIVFDQFIRYFEAVWNRLSELP